MSESCLKLHLGTLFGKTLQAFDVCYNVWGENFTYLKKKINNRIILSLMISFKFFIIILVTGISGLSLIIFGKPKLRKQIPLSNMMHSLVFCMKFWVENLLNLKDYYPLSVMIKILAIMKCLVTAYVSF